MTLHSIITRALDAGARSWYSPRKGRAVMRCDARLALECEIGPDRAWFDRPSFIGLDESPPAKGWVRLLWDGQLVFECPVIERDLHTVMLRPHEAPGRFFLTPREVAFSHVLDALFGDGEYDFMVTAGLLSAQATERDHFTEVLGEVSIEGALPVSVPPPPRSRIKRIRHEVHGRIAERLSRTPKSMQRASQPWR